MPLELHIIHATDFVRVDPHGHFDLAASKKALALVAGACRKRGINQALMDLRALRPGPEPAFTPADLFELVNTFREVGFTHQQHLAILYDSDPHKRARMFACLSAMHGWNVQAFGKFEDALLWLSSSQETTGKPKRLPAAQQIPIRVRKQEANPPRLTSLPSGTPGERTRPAKKGPRHSTARAPGPRGARIQVRDKKKQ
ncbi:MAG: hypothetical protein ABI651_03415 [Verrucomicrobiota bacterium]